MSSLIVDRRGVHLALDGNAIVIREDEERVATIPIQPLSRVFLKGDVSVSANLLGKLGEAGVGVIILAGRRGKPALMLALCVRIVVVSIDPETRGRQRKNEVARYGQSFKDRAVARLLPPESVAVQTLARELSISAATLARWRAEALSQPVGERGWSAGARFEAVLSTAAMDEASKGAWCREHGVYPQTLEQWRTAALQALDEPEEVARQALREKKAERGRIKELERDLRRKEKALAEAAALLVLSKKLEAIFPKDEDA
jgi:transposase-like protein